MSSLQSIQLCYHIGVEGLTTHSAILEIGKWLMANTPKVSTTEYSDQELIGTYELKGDTVVMTFEINPRLAKSEKSMLIFSTGGAETVELDGMEVQMNINAYVPIAKWNALKGKRKKS